MSASPTDGRTRPDGRTLRRGYEIYNVVNEAREEGQSRKAPQSSTRGAESVRGDMGLHVARVLPSFARLSLFLPQPRSRSLGFSRVTPWSRTHPRQAKFRQSLPSVRVARATTMQPSRRPSVSRTVGRSVYRSLIHQTFAQVFHGNYGLVTALRTAFVRLDGRGDADG